MIIYNVTVKIDHEVHDEWLGWMKAVHIPDVMATGLFLKNKLCKVLIDEHDGVTYSIQYTSKNMENIEKYQQEFAPRLQKEHTEKYRNKFVAFRTMLEVIND